MELAENKRCGYILSCFTSENTRLHINAAFAKTLPVAGLLGRIRFFDHFKITFDPTSDPPGLELERVHQA